MSRMAAKERSRETRHAYGPLGPGHEPVKDPMQGLTGVLSGTLVLEAITVFLILLVVLVLTVALRSLRGRLRMNGLALLGLAVLCGFVLVRAVGFHHVDQLISMDFARLPFNFWFENAGLFLIAVNALWPRTLIGTDALNMIPGVERGNGRSPAIMGDAAHAVLVREAAGFHGRFLIDDEVLAEAGITDLDRYAIDPAQPLLPDLFLD